MKRLLMVILLVSIMVLPVCAMEFTAPQAPDTATQYMPIESVSFWQDILYVLKSAMRDLRPQVFEVLRVCLRILAVVLLTSILQPLSSNTKHVLHLVATGVIGVQLLRSADSMIKLGSQTVIEITEYGKLLLPVLTGALAAQGASVTSAALYAGTAMFSALLSAIISKLLVPMVYVYLCLSIANSAIGEAALTQFRDFIKWLLTWSLKILIYVFTGYMSVTGVISGSVDASAIKATKLALSGVVPVVGGMLSDASETILISAGIMKNSVGIYGLVVFTAMLAGPFIKIGVQYLLLKITGMVSNVIATKESTQLIGDFSSAMGVILAMTGTACLLLMISVVCFMKGVA